MTTTGAAEAAVVAALRAAGGWCSVDQVWRACPGVRRRVVRHHLARLVVAGCVAWCWHFDVHEGRVWVDGRGGGPDRYRWCE